MVKLREPNKPVVGMGGEDRAYQQKLSGNKISIIVMLFFSLMGLILSVVMVQGEVSADKQWPLRILLATASWIVVYLLCVYAYYRTFYLLSNAYLLALSLFHLGLIYSIAITNDARAQAIGGSKGDWYELSGWYVVLSFCAFGIGHAIAILINKRVVYSEQQFREYTLKTNRFLFRQGVGMGIAALIFLAMAIMSYGNILAYSRAELFSLTADSRGFGVFMMVLPGAVSLLALAAHTRKQKIFAYSLAIFVVLVIMLSGYRSAALFPALVAVILWVKSGRKIPTVVAVSGVIGVLFAIAMIGVFRTMGAYQELGADDLSASYEQASIGDAFIEMGASVGVLAEVLRLVPEKDPYRYGYSYWKSFTDMFPNIGFSVNQSESRDSKLKDATFDNEALTRMAPADWITYRINRWKFDNGQGVGFSAIAEPYLNFGMPGVVIYFLLLGFILARLDIKEIIYHPYLYLFSAAIFWTLIRTVRNDYSNFTKPMGFIIIILLIWNVGLYMLGKHTKFGKKYVS